MESLTGLVRQHQQTEKKRKRDERKEAKLAALRQQLQQQHNAGGDGGANGGGDDSLHIIVRNSATGETLKGMCRDKRGGGGQGQMLVHAPGVAQANGHTTDD